MRFPATLIERLEERRLLSTNLVADFGGIFPTDSVTVNGVSYFAADDGVHGKELYKSDGTSAGTVLIKDMVAGAESPGIRDFDVINGHVVFFTVSTGFAFREYRMSFWTTDGTKSGTVRIADFGLCYLRFPMTAILPDGDNQRLVFTVPHGLGESDGFGLWSSDGTKAETKLVKEFEGSVSVFSQSDTSGFKGDHFRLPVVDGRAILSVTNDLDVPRLFSTDGTAAGTVDLTTAFHPDVDYKWISASDLTLLDEHTLLFSTIDESDPAALKTTVWRTDGTLNGTVAVADIGNLRLTGPW